MAFKFFCCYCSAPGERGRVYLLNVENADRDMMEGSLLRLAMA